MSAEKKSRTTDSDKRSDHVISSYYSSSSAATSEEEYSSGDDYTVSEGSSFYKRVNYKPKSKKEFARNYIREMMGRSNGSNGEKRFQNYNCWKVMFILTAVVGILIQFGMSCLWGGVFLQLFVPTILFPGEALLPIHHWFSIENNAMEEDLKEKNKEIEAIRKGTNEEAKQLLTEKEDKLKRMFHIVATKDEGVKDFKDDVVNDNTTQDKITGWLELAFKGQHTLPKSTSTREANSQSGTVDDSDIDAPKNAFKDTQTCSHFFEYVANNYDTLPHHVAFVSGNNHDSTHRGLYFQGMRDRLISVQRYLDDAYSVEEKDKSLFIPDDSAKKVYGYFGLNNMPVEKTNGFCDDRFLKDHADLIAEYRKDFEQKENNDNDEKVKQHRSNTLDLLNEVHNFSINGDTPKPTCPEKLEKVSPGDFGSQFVVSRERLHLLPQSFYEQQLEKLQDGKKDVCKFWHSKWHLLFGDTNSNNLHVEYSSRHPILSWGFSNEKEKGHLQTQLMGALNQNYTSEVQTPLYYSLFVFARLLEALMGLSLIFSLVTSGSKKLLEKNRSNPMVYFLILIFLPLSIAHLYFDTKITWGNEIESKYGFSSWKAWVFVGFHAIVTTITILFYLTFYVISNAAKKSYEKNLKKELYSSQYSSQYTSSYYDDDEVEEASSEHLMSSSECDNNIYSYTSSSGAEDRR